MKVLVPLKLDYLAWIAEGVKKGSKSQKRMEY